MKRHLVSCLIAISFFSCGRHVEKHADSVVDLNFDTENRQLLTNIILNEKQILLQTDTKESQFAGIDKLVIHDDRIYILDYMNTRSLFVFDMDGKFLRRIGRRGRGPGEYPALLMDFATDNAGNVLLVDNTKRELHKYAPDGRYITSVHLPFLVEGLVVLENSDYLVALTYPYEEKVPAPQVVVCDSLFNKKEEYFSFSQVGDKLDISPLVKVGGKIVYHREVNDTVYIFSTLDGALTKEYAINFEGMSVPKELRHNYSKLGDESSYRYLYSTPLFVGNYLIGNMIDRDRTAIYCFDVESGESCLIPFVWGSVDPALPTVPLAAVGDSVLVSYLDYGMFAGFKSGTEKDDERLRDYFENGGVALNFFTLKKR
jgi:hypothetical protein